MQAHTTDGTVNSDHILQYGPIQVRLYQKAVPTLATGRRSKQLVLDGDEAAKREKKRQRNREAAKKIKEKRETIESDLDRKLRELEAEHSNLQSYLNQLQQKKQNLQTEVNNLDVDPLEELLSNYDTTDLFSSFEQYSPDFELFDESIQRILNSDSLLDN
ncbi:unnamed protein product [Adineta steineri]|uniref:BZIP domain-containing protein n=1 Tax=Adineta steineri TaxID=433720 RepID=A0A816CEH8_9BILA|nr:unnamed protein product [Adineta steineri]CAF1620905.1 unnamed protein product [Adineta steineri]